jgi:hypothetical protein
LKIKRNLKSKPNKTKFFTSKRKTRKRSQKAEVNPRRGVSSKREPSRKREPSQVYKTQEIREEPKQVVNDQIKTPAKQAKQKQPKVV